MPLDSWSGLIASVILPEGCPANALIYNTKALPDLRKSEFSQKMG